jgi:hypothetical protein
MPSRERSQSLFLATIQEWTYTGVARPAWRVTNGNQVPRHRCRGIDDPRNPRAAEPWTLARILAKDMVPDANRIQRVLRQAWSAKSSTKWSADRPALGQCSPTALVVQDFFGGSLVKTSIDGA